MVTLNLIILPGLYLVLIAQVSRFYLHNYYTQQTVVHNFPVQVILYSDCDLNMPADIFPTKVRKHFVAVRKQQKYRIIQPQF